MSVKGSKKTNNASQMKIATDSAAKRLTSKRHSAIPAATAKAGPAKTPVSATCPAAPVTPAPAVDQAITRLIGELRSADADVAREAAVTLGAGGNPAAVTALIEVVDNADGFFHGVVR